jgi:undecaprenyl diphosphate synthase
MTSVENQEIASSIDNGAGPPEHVAIIMDGNGRWAAARGLPRVEGHRRGVEAVRKTVRAAIKLKVRYLTLYSFSSENWSRPRQEIESLFSLFRAFVRYDVAKLKKAGVRVRIIGRRDGLPPDIGQLIEFCESTTKDNQVLDLILAFNYGARDELARAVAKIAEKVSSGKLAPGEISEGVITDHLDTAGIPDPDLVIRTSGEIRLSNFLLWQCAYSEFVFLPGYWPDFQEAELGKAIEQFHSRSRRYGGRRARSSA